MDTKKEKMITSRWELAIEIGVGVGFLSFIIIVILYIHDTMVKQLATNPEIVNDFDFNPAFIFGFMGMFLISLGLIKVWLALKKPPSSKHCREVID